MRTVAIINQKGGSGKTTTAINLAASLARRKQRTLLIDLDPQSHCALGTAIPEQQIDLHAGDVLTARPGRPLDHSRLIWQVSRNLDLIPSTTKLAGVEAARGGLADKDDRDLRLHQFLTRLTGEYEFCIIDCPPSIGLLTFNALRAATEVLIPVETAYFALQGATKQVATLRALSRRFGLRTPYRILPTMHDINTSLARDILKELRTRFSRQVLDDVVIHLDPRLREAASLGVPIFEYDQTTTGAVDYDALSRHFVTSEIPEPERESERSSSVEVITQEDTRAQPDRAPAPMTRAAELAARARGLSVRSAELNRRLIADPSLTEALKPAAPAAATPTAQLAPTIESKLTPAIQFGPQSTSTGVLFRFPAAPQDAVFLAGDHNGWSTTSTPLRYNPNTESHEIAVPLPAGHFRYRLIVNGQWITDPYNPTVDPNPFGGLDSVVDIKPQSSALVEPAAATKRTAPQPAIHSAPRAPAPTTDQ